MTHYNKSQFAFKIIGYGRYEVSYETRRYIWRTFITDMTLIDAVKNEDYPKQCSMRELARHIQGKVERQRK